MKKMIGLILAIVMIGIGNVKLFAEDIDITKLKPDEPIPTPSFSDDYEEWREQRLQERRKIYYDGIERFYAGYPYTEEQSREAAEKLEHVLDSLYLKKDSEEAQKVAAVQPDYGIPDFVIDPESIQPIYVTGITDWLEGKEMERATTPEEGFMYKMRRMDGEGYTVSVGTVSNDAGYNDAYRVSGLGSPLYYTFDLKLYAAAAYERLAKTELDLSKTTAKYLMIPDFFDGYYCTDGKTEVLFGIFGYDPYDSPKLKELYEKLGMHNQVDEDGSLIIWDSLYCMTRQQATDILSQIDYVQKEDAKKIFGYVPICGNGEEAAMPEMRADRNWIWLIVVGEAVAAAGLIWMGIGRTGKSRQR